MTAVSPESQPRSFYAPQEPDWHRMIAEAAYYLAQKRGFRGEHSLEDWLAAEEQIRQAISPLDSEATMNETSQNQTKSDALGKAKQPADSRRRTTTAKPGPGSSQQDGVSRFEKFAETQAAGDGIEGDALKKDKTVDEKLGANMADRK
jgi:hypothetical protein